MGSIKIERLREKIKVECARVIMTKMNDPRAGFITVQNVELSRDLRHAKVYISVLGADAEKRKVMRMLKDATGFIQREVSGTLRTRVTPALLMVLDTSIDKSFKVAAILEEIKKQKGEAPPPASEDDEHGEDEDDEDDEDEEDDDEEE